MPNILDYVDWRGDLSFSADPFNPVDSLIFSTLSYVTMDSFGPKGVRDGMTLARVLEEYERAGYDQSRLENDPLPLLKKAAGAPRYRPVRVCRAVNLVDPEKKVQFSAVTFRLPEFSYVAFRGTDSTLVGWREDFAFSYSPETHGQREAVRYLDRTGGKGPLYVGGHSKGGNLAVYAAAFCKAPVRERIREVFSFDGPGFRESVTEDERYRSILPRVRIVLPEGSVVGVLQSNKDEKTIVKSRAVGTHQHTPYAWEVRGPGFETVPCRTPASQRFSAVLEEWLPRVSDEQRRRVLEGIFDALSADGAVTFSDLSEASPASVGRVYLALRRRDPAIKKETRDALKKLVSALKDVLWAEARENFNKSSRKKGTEK